MNRHIFFSLINKYLSGSATDFEKNLLDEYYSRLTDQEDTALTPEQKEQVKAYIFRRLQENLQLASGNTKTVRLRVHRIRRIMAVAACIAVLLGTGFYWYLASGDKQKTRKEAAVPATPTDIPPGTDKATLVLSDGSTINLDKSSNSAVAGRTNIQSSKGQLVFSEAISEKGKIHKLATPRSGQYKLLLPDGTKVWLNAASTLKFPAAFNESERRLELEGEAYFEVTALPDRKGGKRPFIVKINSNRGNAGEIEVLGTRFNVNAYNDETNAKITLLEGAINVTAANNRKIRIKPGQQAKLEKGDLLHIDNDVATEETIAWKEGRFAFESTDLKTVMRQIARWYDIEVEYKDGIPQRYFTADLSRNTMLSDVLKVLALSNIHFSVEGRKLTISP